MYVTSVFACTSVNLGFLEGSRANHFKTLKQLTLVTFPSTTIRNIVRNCSALYDL